MCALRIACNTSRRDPDSGGFVERPNYFDVNVYGAPAESVGQFTHKGSRVAIDGRLEWREWETADDQRRQAVSVVADTVQFLDSRAGGSATDAGEDPGVGSGELAGVGAAEEALSF